MNNYNSILNIIYKLIKQIRLNSFYKIFANSILILIVSLTLIILLEVLFRFDSELRFILYSFMLFSIFIFAAINLSAFLYYKTSPFSKKEINNAAQRIGQKYNDIKDQLLNSLQLFEDRDAKFSSELIDASIEAVHKNLSQKDLSNVINQKPVLNKLRNSFIFLVLFAALLSFTPLLKDSITRIINYHLSYEAPARFTFDVKPGNKRITKGMGIDFQISIEGENLSSISFYKKESDDADYKSVLLSVDSTNKAAYSLNEINRSFEYFVSNQEIKSPVYKIDVINRPSINSFTLEIIPPKYSNLQSEYLKDNGNIRALKGSKVRFNLTANKELNSAEITFTDSSKTKMEVNGKNAKAELTLLEDNEYYIDLIDFENIANENPIVYQIKILDDEFPIIELIEPLEDFNLGATDLIPISLDIKDDFGFSKLVLNYKLSASRYKEINNELKSLPIEFEKGKNELSIYHVWNLSTEMLVEEDVITFYLEIFDNDYVSGPKSAKSISINIRVPSLDELFAEADKVNKSAQDEFKEILEESKKLSDELNKIDNELKQDSKEITYEEKDKIEKALQKFDELTDKVEEAQKQIQEMQKDLAENNLLSEETLQKYMELQELLDELSSPEMRESLERMQEMLKSLNRDQVQNAMEDMKFDEEMFQKSVERTLNLLKRVQAEQKMDELVKRTENLNEQLEDLQKQTEQSDLNNQQENKELQQKQNDATKSLEKLEQEMQSLKEMLDEIPELSSEQLEEMQNEFDKQENQETSENAKEQIAQKMKQSAMQQQQKLSKNMQNMQQQMQQMMDSMMMQSQMETIGEMYKALDNLLSLSKTQERLKEESRSMSPNSPQFNEKAQEQNELMQNLNRVMNQLGDLSQKTFAITPEMGKALGDARSEMSQAISQMQGRNGSLAFQKQSGAMKSLNEAANLMQSNLNQMMNQSGGGSGMMSMMQQLQQMSQQQMNLNQMTQMMKNGQMTQQQMAQMQRLALQQQMIQKSLEQLNKENKESGQSKKLPANLDDIIQEMKEVVQNMNTQKLDDDLIKSQDKILSKLLDAQRSINERDFEKNRESNSGKNISSTSPAELNLNNKETIDKLRDQILNSAKEGYSKDYQELIRKYFEALQKRTD